MPKQETKSHIKGLISDPDVAVKPFDSVYDAYNIDFYGQDEPRKPILKLSSNEQLTLPSGYKISDIYLKKFTDADGIDVECIIAVAYKTSSDVKIYVNNWYNPSTDYANNKNGSTGWVAGWTELTSQESFVLDLDTYVDSDRYVTFNTGINTTTKGSDYYKGQFIYDGSGNCAGIITNNSASSDSVFVVRLNSYVNSGALDTRTVTDGGTYYIEKFPVNVRYNTEWTNISNDIASGVAKVSFTDTFNSVKICFGKKYRVLNLCFLQERTYFKNVTVGSTTNAYKQAWNGFWFGYDSFEIDNKLKRTSYETTSGTSNIFVSGGSSSYSVNYDGISLSGQSNFSTYFENDFLETGIILHNKVYFNLVNVNDGANSIYGNIESYKDDLWAYALEFDGYQSIFLKTFLACRFHQIFSGKTHYFKNILETKAIFKVDFDRRITGLHTFYEKKETYNDNTNPIETKKLRPFLLDDSYGGNVKIETDDSSALPSSDFNTYAVAINPLPDKQGWLSPYGQAEPSDYNANSEYKSLFEENPRNNELSLNAYLGQYWYSKINVRFDTIIKVGENIVGINVNSKDLEDGAKFGEVKIVMSNIQFPSERPVNAQSVFVSERAVTITEQKLIGGKDLDEKSFTAYTSNSMIWVQIYDDKKLLLKYTEYKQKGTYSHKSIVSAKIGTQNGGDFYPSRDSIYMFINGKYQDLLLGRWRKAYQQISDNDKKNIVAGFYPERKEVYFTFDYQNIFIYNIEFDNWKKYKYPAVTGNKYYGFIPSDNGQMYFHDGVLIYSTLSRQTAKYKDNQVSEDHKDTAGGDAINFYLRKLINTGNDKGFKVPNMFEIYYDSSVYNAGETKLKFWVNDKLTSKQGDCNLEGTGGTVINLIDNPAKFVMTMPLRNSFNYFNIELESYVVSSLQGFALKEMHFETLLNLSPEQE